MISRKCRCRSAGWTGSGAEVRGEERSTLLEETEGGAGRGQEDQGDGVGRTMRMGDDWRMKILIFLIALLSKSQTHRAY